jgi:Flp pilus assembly pilin Flp
MIAARIATLGGRYAPCFYSPSMQPTRVTRAFPRSPLRALRGATMVEYALLVIAVMLLAAAGYRALGKTVRMNADNATEELMK